VPRQNVDRPIAVISGVNTASPATLFVHVDHLNRPTMMTNSAKASVWAAIWTPWGTPQSITGAETNDARFPGQWFQLEAGLAYNWHRHYDPSLGRYTQPDPLGFVDGPSVYAYAGSKPSTNVDVTGLFQQCTRPAQSLGILGITHCFMKFGDGTTLSFDGAGVHKDPDPDHRKTVCTKPKQDDKDDCIQREMKKCSGFYFIGNYCCGCIAKAMKACDAN
jgi:RHS repeat-associated protein